MFRIEEAPLSYCRGIYNSEKQKYEVDNSMNIMQCCLEECVGRVKSCYEKCPALHSTLPGLEKCLHQCYEISENCKSVCLNYPSEGVKLIYECGKKNGCEKNTSDFETCMRDKKDKVHECCINECLPTSTENCKEQCSQFLEEIQNGITRRLDTHVLPASKLLISAKKDTGPTIATIIAIIMCCVIFGGLLLLGIIKYLEMKNGL